MYKIEKKFKRNAKAFPPNAIVDVRRRLRCHEMKTVSSDFKIYRNLALDGLYISAGNDIINYFRSVANRTNVKIVGRVRAVIFR